MNLWFRLLWLVVTFRWRGLLAPPLGVSRVRFRVWPLDLDTSLHMNNGRYWTLMDLGRSDLMLRMGLWRAVVRNGWTPVVSAGSIRFRRELRLWQPFVLETRILCWLDNTVVIEHRLIVRSRAGEPYPAAIALVRAGLYDRKGKAFVPIARLMTEMGLAVDSPPPSAEVAAFLAAEDAMKGATSRG